MGSGSQVRESILFWGCSVRFPHRPGTECARLMRICTSVEIDTRSIELTIVLFVLVIWNCLLIVFYVSLVTLIISFPFPFPSSPTPSNIPRIRTPRRFRLVSTFIWTQTTTHRFSRSWARHSKRGRHLISACQSLIMSQRSTFTFFFLGEAPQLPNMVIKVPTPFSHVGSERLDFSYTLV